MKKSLAIAAMLTTALFTSSLAQAGSYQDRAMTTGALFGGATGAAIGSNNDQAVEGAIFGAVIGTIAGAIIADIHQPAPVIYSNHKPSVKRHVYSHHRSALKRHAYKQQRHADRVAEHRAQRRYDRQVARGYGHHSSRWGDYRTGKRHDKAERLNRHERSERRHHRGHDES